MGNGYYILGLNLESSHLDYDVDVCPNLSLYLFSSVGITYRAALKPPRVSFKCRSLSHNEKGCIILGF